MRKLITIVVIILGFTMSVKSQSYRGTPPQKPIKPLFSVPVFKDSLKLKRDIRNLHTLKKIYDALKKENVGTAYQYGFSIDTTGHIILGMKEDRIYLKELNEYIETIFKNYTWIPSHKLNCKTCFVMQLAYFIVIFNTAENYISCAITVSGSIGQIFYEKIIMK